MGRLRCLIGLHRYRLLEDRTYGSSHPTINGQSLSIRALVRIYGCRDCIRTDTRTAVTTSIVDRRRIPQSASEQQS